MIARLDALLATEGSTRSAGLLRCGLGLIVLAEFGHGAALFWNHEPLRQIVGALLLLAASAMAVGLFSRTSTAVTAALLVVQYHWIGVHGGVKEGVVHAHTYLLMAAIVLVALLPNGRSLSLDRLRALRRGLALPERGPLWALTLIRLQLALVYFWGAVDKSNLAFLSGSRLQQIAAFYFGSHEGVRLPFFDELMVVAAVATVVLEYSLAFGLWFAPARRFLIPCGIVFHALIFLTLPVGTFSVTSLLLYVAFLPPRAVHDAVGRLAGQQP